MFAINSTTGQMIQSQNSQRGWGTARMKQKEIDKITNTEPWDPRRGQVKQERDLFIYISAQNNGIHHFLVWLYISWNFDKTVTQSIKGNT